MNILKIETVSQKTKTIFITPKDGCLMWTKPEDTILIIGYSEQSSLARKWLFEL